MGYGRRRRSGWQFWVVVCLAVWVISAAWSANDRKNSADASSRSPEPGTLLFVTDQKDGDSWVASDGTEYRLGLINTPERDETCSAEATAFTRRFLARGFTADAYATDRYGRAVAEVFDTKGRSLNVKLAKSGLGDGRYLDQFRHENPDLARRLDKALESAARPSCA